MAKPQRSFVCQSCGAAHARWAGRCEDCGVWNSIAEEATASTAAAAGGKARGRRLDLVALEGAAAPPPRLASGIDELDRVLGGGIVPGAALLIGGDPGIGKSTLMLQAAAAIARIGNEVVYVSGEESVDQIRLRATRLGLARAAVRLASATSVGDILATVDHPRAPALVIVDSIQTMWVDGLEQAPGTVSQLRAAAQGLIRFAKQRGSALMLIGHVTKDGQIAGPRVLEHMVDAVLYFEGERGHQFRILRAVKNRFGPANEIGVFEMAEAGLEPVPNPSALFLADREDGIAGAAVFAGMEGSRPLLMEIQALVAPSGLATPRRAVVGWDGNRLSMILAVLEAHCGVRFGQHDVYLNVAGGLRIQEPAADLAVAAALVSSLAGVALGPDCVYFGEVSLSGAVRPVAHASARLKEAEKLGFARAVAPLAGSADETPSAIAATGLAQLSELVARIAAAGRSEPEPRRFARS
jgi:DNA repair protein RadA/Sms